MKSKCIEGENQESKLRRWSFCETKRVFKKYISKAQTPLTHTASNRELMYNHLQDFEAVCSSLEKYGKQLLE